MNKMTKSRKEISFLLFYYCFRYFFVLYRDYIVSEDEKLKLLKEEQEQKLKIEKELREKYNPDNIFKKKNIEENIQINNVQLIEIKETSWFKKALDKILKFFGRKK